VSQEFGQFCRLLRKRMGLTQIQFASKASLSVRTVIYWETGEREPRSEEIAVALEALRATPAERDRAYLLLTSTRGIQLARQQIRVSAGSGRRSQALPDLGDLLVALRVRAGWTREQLAAQMQLKVSTITGWERTEHLPGDEVFVRLCDLLKALPEEREALITRRLTPTAQQTGDAWEELAARIDVFERDAKLRQTPLIDLQALALKRSIWLSARQRQEADLKHRYQHLAAHVDTIYGAWLIYQERNTEAGQCVHRALNLVGRNLGSCGFASFLLNTASCWATLNQGCNYDEGIYLLKRWLPGVADSQARTEIYCDLSYYAAAAGYREQSCQYLQLAQNNFVRATPKSDLRCYFKFTLARVMAHARRFEEALTALSDCCEAPGGISLFRDLIHAEILWQAQLRNEAHCAVQKLETDLQQHPSVLIARRTASLAAQL
jgi:transcriptional regulator with XRE-family HTH domain